MLILTGIATLALTLPAGTVFAESGAVPVTDADQSDLDDAVEVEEGEDADIEVDVDGSDVEATSAGGGTAYAFPGQGWGPVSESNTAIFGRPGATVTISWTVAPGTNQHACVQGRGGDGTWHGLGCGTSNTVTIPWGDWLGQPAVRVNTTSPIHMASVTWQH